MRKIYTAIYSRNSVLEAKESAKIAQKGEWKEYFGRLQLRAATLTTGDDHRELVMSLTPAECYKLSLVIKQIVKNGGRKVAILHKPNQEEERYTEVVVEKWENNGRSGYAIILQIRTKENGRDRIELKINVPVDKVELLAFADFLQGLNTLLRWRGAVKVESGGEEPEETPPEEPVEINDDDLDDIDL